MVNLHHFRTNLLLAGLVLATLDVGIPAQAEFNHYSVGRLTYFSNVNYEETNADSDWRLSAAHYANGSTSIGYLSLNAKIGKFVSEDQNDFLSWGSRLSWEKDSPPFGPFSLWTSLSGQNYFNGSPATTESRFDNVGAEVGIDFTKGTKNKEFAYGAFYSLTAYQNFDGRKDHGLTTFGELLYSKNHWTLIPSADFSYFNSSLNEYSRYVLGLAIQLKYQTSGPWTLGAGLDILTTSFTSRTVTQTTAISRGRGQVVQGTQTTNEKHSYSEVEIFGERPVLKKFKLSTGLRTPSQSSKSGLQDFSGLEIFVGLSSSY